MGAQDSFIQEAVDRYKAGSDANVHNVENSLSDQKFLYISSWTDKMKKNRRRRDRNRPCLEINKQFKYLKRISNEVRLNKPGVKISPEDDKSDKKTADKIKGLIKQSLKNSKFDMVAAQAFENAVESSFGFYRVLTKFVSDDSFDQDIDIQYIVNPNSVVLDPSYESPTASDCEWGFITHDMPKDEFKQEFPDAEMNDFSGNNLGDSKKSWMGKDFIRVVEYYYMKKIHDELIEYTDPKAEDPDEEIIAFKSDMVKDGIDFDSIITGNTRPTVRKTWHWAKLNAIEVLEEEDLPGTLFPIIGVFGRRKVINNKLYLLSLIRKSKDSQRMYNYWRSSEAEKLNQANKTEYIGAKGQFKSDPGWKDGNRNPTQTKEYDPIAIGGVLVPAPQIVPPPDAPIGYIAAAQSSEIDIKDTMGMSDGVVGDQGQEISGIAIDNRVAQGEITTYDFIDNFNMSVKQTYVVVFDIIRKIMDVERSTRILGDDGVEEMVTFNAEPGEDNEGDLFHLNVGRYDVDIDVGPDFATKRKDAAEAMQATAQALPEAAALGADLIIRGQDFNGSEEWADRSQAKLRQTNPEIFPDPESENLSEAEKDQLLVQSKGQVDILSQENEQLKEFIKNQEIQREIADEKNQAMLAGKKLDNETKLELQDRQDEKDVLTQVIDSRGELGEELIKAGKSVSIDKLVKPRGEPA